MSQRAYYADPAPEDGYTAPFRIAFYTDYPNTMTILWDRDERFLSFLREGGSLEAYEAPATVPSFVDLPRPSFLFMMGKIGVTQEQVEGLIGMMPEGTEEEQDAKTLALIVFRNQQTFKRDNSLLASLAAAAGISSETIDTAWQAAEGLTW